MRRVLFCFLICFCAASATTCTYQSDVDYQDSGTSAKASSKDECCKLCAENAKCQVAVFSDKMCYLKVRYLMMMHINLKSYEDILFEGRYARS